MMVSVFRTGDQSAIEFAGPSTSTSRDTRARLPAGMSVTVWQDAAESLSSQCSHMPRNGFPEFVLVFPVLTLFSVELRLAFWGASASRPRSSARSR